MHACGATTRTGQSCKNAAQANGRCRMHGGGAPGRPLIHGRYSLAHRTALAEKVETFLMDSRPGDLSDELALMRALLQDYLERFPSGQPLPANEIERVMAWIETIGRLVERISRILTQTALTAAEVRLLQARLADVLVRHIDDPGVRLAILDELAEAVGGDPGNAQPALTADAE
jgi:hypothetical protein